MSECEVAEGLFSLDQFFSVKISVKSGSFIEKILGVHKFKKNKGRHKN